MKSYNSNLQVLESLPSEVLLLAHPPKALNLVEQADVDVVTAAIWSETVRGPAELPA